jgi:hypothetical protein
VRRKLLCVCQFTTYRPYGLRRIRRVRRKLIYGSSQVLPFLRALGFPKHLFRLVFLGLALLASVCWVLTAVESGFYALDFAPDSRNGGLGTKAVLVSTVGFSWGFVGGWGHTDRIRRSRACGTPRVGVPPAVCRASSGCPPRPSAPSPTPPRAAASEAPRHPSATLARSTPRREAPHLRPGCAPSPAASNLSPLLPRPCRGAARRRWSCRPSRRSRVVVRLCRGAAAPERLRLRLRGLPRVASDSVRALSNPPPGDLPPGRYLLTPSPGLLESTDRAAATAQGGKDGHELHRLGLSVGRDRGRD